MKHPEHAYAPNGELWWHLAYYPDSIRTFGDEPKIAAYLASTKVPGDLFTTEELREAIPLESGTANTKEHFQRRIRELRGPRDCWKISSIKDDKSLPQEHYRVDATGWHPALGPRAKNYQRPSKATRTKVLLRDGSRCQICGIADGEPYPDDPGRVGVMTVGHILAQDRGGSNDESNLRAECAVCNEPLRSEGRNPESLDELVSVLRTLKKSERQRLNEWLACGHRTRDALDEAYDRARRLPLNQFLTFTDIVRKSF